MRQPARLISNTRMSQASPGIGRSRYGVLTIVSQNVNGFNSGASMVTSSGISDHAFLGKLNGFVAMWRALSADIVLLQETHFNSSNMKLFTEALRDWECIWGVSRTSRSTKASGGTGILIRKRALVQNGGHISIQPGSIVKHRSGRLTHLKISWLGHSLHIASVYLSNSPTEQRAFIKDTLAPLSKSVGNRTCLWGGDYNFAPIPALDRVTDGQPVRASHPDAATGAHWVQQLPEIIDAFRSRHPHRKEYSRLHRRGASRIDHIYVSLCGLPYVSASEVVRKVPGSGSISDHRPVMLRFLHQSPLASVQERTGRRRTLAPRVHTDFLKDNDLAQEYRTAVAAWAAQAPEDATRLLAWWPHFKSRLAALARKLNSKFRAQHVAAAIAAEARLALLEDRVIRGDAEAAVELQGERRSTRQQAAAVVRATCPFIHPREYPSPALTQIVRPPKSASCGPPLRTPDGGLVSAPGGCAEILVTHYASISEAPTIDPAAQAEVLAALEGSRQLPAGAGGGLEVVESEVLAVLKKARPTQAGIDGLKVILYRAAAESFAPLLAQVFSAIGALNRLPRSFHAGVIIPIHKGGDRTLASEYRPITLLNTDYRLLAALLGTRLKPHMGLVIDPVQTAFISGRSIGENIMSLQLLPQALAAAGRSGLIVFCDFKKAFDTVDRAFLLKVMRALGASDALLQWVRLFLTDTLARALVMGQLSSSAVFNAGVRQGCPLSPLLYLFIGQALLCLLRKRGVGITLPGTHMLPPLPLSAVGGAAALVPASFAMTPAVAMAPAVTGPPISSTANMFADDTEAHLGSVAEVPPFVAAMTLFGAASNQRLHLGKTCILPIGKPMDLPAGSMIAGLRVVDEATALGITFHRGTGAASAPWEKLKLGVLRCYGRIARGSMSAFGRGIASAAYGVSSLLHAAEFVPMPRSVKKALISATTALVDNGTAPSTTETVQHEKKQRSFVGIPGHLLCGAPSEGGLGALPLEAHIQARIAKWGLSLIINGTSKPWTQLAWFIMGRMAPQFPPCQLLYLHVQLPTVLQQLSNVSLQVASLGLPNALLRILQPLEALPALGRRIQVASPNPLAVLPSWLALSWLISWRLYRSAAYISAILDLGAPAWLPPPSFRAPAGGILLQAYSVRLGSRMLNTPALEERAARYLLFIEEAGGSLPAGITAISSLLSSLSRLWRLPLSNDLKETYWRCFLNGLPTAARMHKKNARGRCGCNATSPRPDRLHHFATCPVAVAVLDVIASCLPPAAEPNLVVALRLPLAPPRIHQGVWDIVSLAACAAMDRGRRHWVHRLLSATPSSPVSRGPALAAHASSVAISTFWEVLQDACFAPLPLDWRVQVGATHPFIRWDTAAERWAVSRPLAPSL